MLRRNTHAEESPNLQSLTKSNSNSQCLFSQLHHTGPRSGHRGIDFSDAAFLARHNIEQDHVNASPLRRDNRILPPSAYRAPPQPLEVEPPHADVPVQRRPSFTRALSGFSSGVMANFASLSRRASFDVKQSPGMNSTAAVSSNDLNIKQPQVERKMSFSASEQK